MAFVLPRDEHRLDQHEREVHEGENLTQQAGSRSVLKKKGEKVSHVGQVACESEQKVRKVQGEEGACAKTIEVGKQGIQPRVRYEFRPPGTKANVRWVARVD